MPAYERANAGGIQNGERKGEFHFHANGTTFGDIGRWGDKEHPVVKRHRQDNLTDTGRELHTQHAKEVSLERRDRKWVVIKAKYSGLCRRCKTAIQKDATIQWHEKLGTKCAPGTPCDKGEKDLDGYSEPSGIAIESDKQTNEPASEEDFVFFQSQMAKLEEKVLAATAQAEKAEERADDAENATRDAVDLLDRSREVEIVLTREDKTTRTKIKNTHENFVRLVRNTGLHVNTALVGEAGSGKTSAGRQLAKALKLDFYHVPLGPQTSKSDLLGYNSGSGRYIESLMRMGVEKGGIILLDEMDAANAAILTIVNAIVDAQPGELLGFPDSMVKKHKDCHFVAAMNTYGRGADAMYVGRAQLDAATLDRWAYLEWNTDWALAHKLVGSKYKEWTNYIQSLATSVSDLRIRAVIGMRAVLTGAKLLAAKIDQQEVEQTLLWSTMSTDDKQKILANVKTKKDSKKREEDEWGNMKGGMERGL